MTANLRIVPLNHHDAATLTTSIAPATGFPATNTQNSTRSLVWKSPDGTAQTVSGVTTANRSATFFGMFIHACAGANVRLQLYSDIAWASQVYDSTALAVNNVTPTDTYDWGTGSNDPFAGQWPFWIWFASTTFRSYKISFSGTPTAGYFQASRFWLGKAYEFFQNWDLGGGFGWVDNSDRNRSRAGSSRRSRGGTWRIAQGNMNGLVESDARALLDMQRYCGTSLDVVVSLFPEEATARERDNVVDCTFVNLNILGRQVGRLTNNLQFEEV
jgi:hypothetical protein